MLPSIPKEVQLRYFKHQLTRLLATLRLKLGFSKFSFDGISRGTHNIMLLSCLGGTQGYKALMNSKLMDLFIPKKTNTISLF